MARSQPVPSFIPSRRKFCLGVEVAQKLVEASPKELVIAVINADSENSQIIPYKATAGQVDYRRNKQTTSEVTGGPEL